MVLLKFIRSKRLKEIITAIGLRQVICLSELRPTHQAFLPFYQIPKIPFALKKSFSTFGAQ